MIINLCKILLLVLAIDIFSCQPKKTFNNQLNVVEGRKYRDLNYFKLEGIDELKDYQVNEYPYFEISDKNENEKIIKLKYSKEDPVLEYDFQRKENYWFQEIAYYGDAAKYFHYYKYIYIFENRAVRLIYKHDFMPKGIQMGNESIDRSLASQKSSHYLHSVEIITENGSTKYIYSENKIWITPSYEIERETEKLDFIKVFQNSYTVENNLLITEEKQLHPEKEGKDVFEKRCFNRVDKWGYEHNIFWNSVFQLGDEVECE